MLIYDPLVIASGSHDPSGYVNVRLSLTVILTSVNLTGPPSEASAEAGMLVETPIRLKLAGSVVLPSAVLVKLGLSSVTVYVPFPSSLTTKSLPDFRPTGLNTSVYLINQVCMGEVQCVLLS